MATIATIATTADMPIGSPIRILLNDSIFPLRILADGQMSGDEKNIKSQLPILFCIFDSN